MSEEKTIVIIDASQLTEWDFCRYKYKLRYKDFMLPIRKDKNLDIGTVLHEMLRVYYFLKRQGGIDHDKIVECCLRRGRKVVATDSELSPDEIAFLFKMFNDYCTFYRNENWIPLQVEKAFVASAFEDEKYQFLIQGKVDLIVRIPGLSDAVIVDHKKRSRLKSESGLDHQKIVYSKYLNISTFIVNKLGWLKTKPNEEKFRREVISYNEEQIEEWYKEFVMTIKEMIAYEKIDFYKRNPTSCDKWAGCAYKPWCNAPDSRRSSMLGEIYQIGTEWDVSKHLEESE